MPDELSADTERLTAKLDEIKSRLESETGIFNHATNDIINTVAISTVLSNELKEILILLHTTMNTELTEAKISNFKVRLSILDTAREIVVIQLKLSRKIAELEKTRVPANPKDISSFFKLYRIPVSIVIIVTTLWSLTVINGSAMESIYNRLPEILKGVLHV